MLLEHLATSVKVFLARTSPNPAKPQPVLYPPSILPSRPAFISPSSSHT